MFVTRLGPLGLVCAALLGCSDGGSSSSSGGASNSSGGASSSSGGASGSGGKVASGGNSASNGGNNASGGALNSAGGSAGSGGNTAGGTTAAGGSGSGGTANGGSTTGGGSNSGGVANGGSSTAGSANSGGKASGGATNGGTANGGTAGSTSKGGGTANGGTANGGAANGGATNTGGAASGGATGTASVRIVGRTLSSGANSRFGWPGVAFYARFSGTQASIQLNDGSYGNAFEVVVDGGTPKKFRTASGQSSYSLASGLAAGNHDVVVWRSTEYYDTGVTEFVAINGFSSGGALLPPAAAPDRRIEVIGDSISVGAGLEGGASGCAADKNSTDNYFAYGSVAARAVGADVMTTAYSGIGVYRSYGGSDPTMPTRYDRALPADTTAWDFSKYQPHVVVINLGTNDFGSGDPGQPYVDAYVNFVKHVRSKYANAYFILIAMYGNQETAINSVVTNLKNGGETKVELLKFSSAQNNLGCAQHPNAAAHQAMGSLLTTRLKAVMSW